MVNSYLKIGFSVVVLGVLFAGCGGSGRGSSSSISLSKLDSASIAPATVDTGKKVAENLKDTNSVGSIQNGMSSFSTNEQSTSTFSQVVYSAAKKAVDSSTFEAKSSRALKPLNSRTVTCPNGGTIKVSGSSSYTKADIDATYNDCSINGITFDGKMDIKITAQNETLSSMLINFPSNLSMRDMQNHIEIYQGSSILMDNIKSNALDMTTTMVADVNGKMEGSKNSKWRISGNSMYQISGQEYIDDLKNYVTYDTSYDMSQTPLVFSSNGLISGEAHYIAQGGGKVIVKVENDGVHVKVDADNDGTFESDEVIE